MNLLNLISWRKNFYRICDLSNICGQKNFWKWQTAKFLELSKSEISGGRKLAKPVTSAWREVVRLNKDRPKIAIFGGLARNRNYVKMIQEYNSQKIPFANFIEPHGDNLDGSIWLANNFLTDAPTHLCWAREDKNK